jgi:hypothetical protein
MIFSFGHAERERIEVDVHGYDRLTHGANWYDNWLTVQIRVQAGGFHGEVAAEIVAGELVTFASQLRPLYETLNGSAEFSTMEGQLSLRLVGDGAGHIELRGEVSDQAGVGNCLHFTLRFDQTQLGASIRELEKITSHFPARVA